MADLTAVVWTRATGTPRRLATVVASDTGVARLTYDGGAIRDRLPGISMAHDPHLMRDKAYPTSFANILPPALAELAPPPHPAGRLNPQRAIVQAMAEALYRERGWSPANQHQNEWELLLLSGRGGIGVLDVFRSDEQAQRWYATEPTVENLLLDRDGLAAAFRSAVDRTSMLNPASLSRGADAALPSIGGMMPKAIARWHPDEGQVYLDIGGGAPVQRPGIPVVVKVEPSAYEGIVELEELAFQACEAIGLPTPRRWTLRPPDFRPMLIVERLDIGPDGALPMETVFSVLFERFAGKVSSPTAAPYEAVEAVFNAPGRIPGSALRDRAAARKQLFKQVALALLTGNGDLHMRNLALIGDRSACSLSPVFDPAPMRAWWEHDVVAACNLGNLDLDRVVPPKGLGEALLTFARQCGFAPGSENALFADLLECGAVFMRQASDSAFIPPATKQQLLKSIRATRREIESVLPRLLLATNRVSSSAPGAEPDGTEPATPPPGP